MKKEIKINFSYVKHEYLVSFFENNELTNWEIVNDSKEVQKLIAEYYFPNKSE